MPLAAGDKLGPYEILALVGRGGMGEVYCAHDPRLHRDVAIKVANADFTERFTQEARAIAALNHTNICHLYDVGPNYLVMEYVEGSDLRGPLAFDDALPLIHQLIDGIEAAHEKGIVHRDLKPANIKITPEGVVKILDFGLAKQNRDSDGAGSDPENSPTLTIGATQAGAILGTAAYMAPEQAKGKTADKRSDIWSFGVILYELLTGRRLFPGETTVEILAGVLNSEPDLSAAPARVHELLRWCLEKDRKKRLASISDARRLLDTPASPSREAGVSNSNASLSAPSQSRFRAVTAVAAVAVLAAAAVSFVHFQETRPTERVLRLAVPLGEGNNPGFLDLSPDGESIVISGVPPGTRGSTQLYIYPQTRFYSTPRALRNGGRTRAILVLRWAFRWIFCGRKAEDNFRRRRSCANAVQRSLWKWTGWRNMESGRSHSLRQQSRNLACGLNGRRVRRFDVSGRTRNARPTRVPAGRQSFSVCDRQRR